MSQKYKAGQRVWLAPFEEEPRQSGEILEVFVDGNYIIDIDPEYRSGPGDDGIRDQVPEDQIEGLAE